MKGHQCSFFVVFSSFFLLTNPHFSPHLHYKQGERENGKKAFMYIQLLIKYTSPLLHAQKNHDGLFSPCSITDLAFAPNHHLKNKNKGQDIQQQTEREGQERLAKKQKLREKTNIEETNLCSMDHAWSVKSFSSFPLFLPEAVRDAITLSLHPPAKKVSLCFCMFRSGTADHFVSVFCIFSYPGFFLQERQNDRLLTTQSTFAFTQPRNGRIGQDFFGSPGCPKPFSETHRQCITHVHTVKSTNVGLFWRSGHPKAAHACRQRGS